MERIQESLGNIHKCDLKENKKGITLVALVITIVILLILAGISISALTNTGLFGKAKEAKEKSENAALEQNKILDNYEKEVDQYLPAFTGKTVKEAIQHGRILNVADNTELHDEKGNKIVVPAGFKVTGDATTVDKGIVIEDATTGATSGSQFVWVPVSKDRDDKIKKADGTEFTIILNRYTFADDENGTATAQDENIVGNYFSETESKGNTVAKSISKFKSSLFKHGGYYIGRYEARTTVARENKENSLTQITERKADYVYNYVTQKQAAEQAQKMYNSSNFTSDLMNSYAWDTATLFLQSCGTNPKYSRQNSLNQTLVKTGTTGDMQCNICDMASNILEWTTETSSRADNPCVYRGGNYSWTSDYTSVRVGTGDSFIHASIGFRPILYINV